MPPLALFVLLALAPRADADGDHARVDIRPLAPARAVAGLDTRRHVAGELLITNYHGDTGPLSLVRAEVFAGAATAPLAVLDGDDLASRVSHPGRPAAQAAQADARAIAGGEHVLLYLWITLSDGAAPPRVLRHTLTFRAPTGRERRVAGITMPVLADEPSAVGPPFRSGLWLAHQGPGNHRSHHWGSQLADGGRVTIPQRFAIDFIGLDDGGRAVREGDGTPANDDWIGFGADVVAVADGVVRDVRDGMRDNVPLAPLPPPASISARGLYGNYVIVESGRRFVHYAHLQRGSVRVQAGQRVRRGEPLGRVGNSGNTTGPHLHLHVSDRATFEGSDGLPLVIGPLQVAGRASIEQTTDLRGAALTLSAAGPWRAGVPLHGQVLRVGAARADGQGDRGHRAR